MDLPGNVGSNYVSLDNFIDKFSFLRFERENSVIVKKTRTGLYSVQFVDRMAGSPDNTLHTYKDMMNRINENTSFCNYTYLTQDHLKTKIREKNTPSPAYDFQIQYFSVDKLDILTDEIIDEKTGKTVHLTKQIGIDLRKIYDLKFFIPDYK